jgi:hypothetical protein
MTEIAPAFLDQPGLIEQLVTFENQLIVPRWSKGEPDPLFTQPPLGLVRSLLDPPAEALIERRKRARFS